MIPKSLRRKLYHIVDFIYMNELKFMNTFMGEGFTDLIKVSVSQDFVEFVVIHESGQHVGNSITIEQYNEWFFNFPKEVRAEFYNTIKGKNNASIEKECTNFET